MKISDFDYELPEEYIAQTPAEPRDASKLMVLNRERQSINHFRFKEITEFLNSGDVLVLNNTRVIPARIAAFRADTQGKLELLLLRKLSDVRWRVLIGKKRAFVGMHIAFSANSIQATVVEEGEGPEHTIEFSEPIEPHLPQIGQTPLPPYIQTRLSDDERYQTIYSHYAGSAAAPTAGLHFTPELFLTLREKGVRFAYCTLHIGLDTFQPVKVEDIKQHRIHSERAQLRAEDAQIINEAKLAGKRVIAVGTTSARTLESAAIISGGGDPANPREIPDACPWRPVVAFEADTRLFIYPGYHWRVVDALITNFHLPKSTLLMMISSFAGREFILQAYETAKMQGYRFFSFGDAMLIL